MTINFFFLFELRYFSKEFNSWGIRTCVSYRVQLSRELSRLPLMESLLAGQSSKEREDTRIVCSLAVADLDLQMGGGGRSSGPKVNRGARSQKKKFSAHQAAVWSKNKGGDPGPVGPVGPSAGSVTVWVHFFPIHPQSDTF